MADALEKVAYHHLHAHQREQGDHDAIATGGDTRQLRTCTEGMDDQLGHQFAHQEGRGGDRRGCNHAVSQHQPHPVVEMGSPVVAHNGLHALYQAKDDGDEHKQHTVHDAIGPDGQVTSVLQQPVVADEHHQTGTGIHQERAQADGQYLPHDVGMQTVGAPAQVEQFTLSAEEAQLHRQRDSLCQDGGPGSTSNAPSEAEDKQRVQHRVDEDGEEGEVHGRLGMSCASQHGIQPEVAMGDNVAQQDDEHVFVGIGQCGTGGPEDAQDGVHEIDARHGKDDSNQNVQRERVAQDMLCHVIFPLAQPHADDRAGPHAHHGTQCGGQVHKRVGHGHAADGHVSHALPHKDAVYDVIGGGCHHGDDGRQGIFG